MKTLLQNFNVPYQYPVKFTKGLFNANNLTLRDIINETAENKPRKVAIVIDSGVTTSNDNLLKDIKNYFKIHDLFIDLTDAPLIIEGGEQCKNNWGNIEKILMLINNSKICKHSFLIVIGGGALLDVAGFAAAIAHRGIHLVRVPTTVLSQNDSGIGVKNSFNAFNKKNFIGTFSPPFAVINDIDFLETLSDRDWLAGIAEAIKVALLKDPTFFHFLKNNAEALNLRNKEVMSEVIFRCAELHLQHIASSGDPFEMGSSRPLDFGHWAAHKIEILTDFSVRHGEAVAAGMAIDCTYAYMMGFLNRVEWKNIINIISAYKFPLFYYQMKDQFFFDGLEEFREHLGGKLTITLLNGIGSVQEVNIINYKIMMKAINLMEKVAYKPVGFSQNLNQE